MRKLSYFSIFFILVIFSCNRSSQTSTIATLPLSTALFQEDEEKVMQELTYTNMERELEYLMNIWPGEYDNVEQLDFDKYYGREDISKGGHLRMHVFVERVELPEFGDDVMYTEAYINDDPEQVFAQSIYVLRADNDKKRILAQRYNFKKADPKRAMGDKTLDFLEDLKPEDSRISRRCDLLFERNGMEFIGTSASVDCHKDMAKDGIVTHFEVRIAKDLFAFQLPKYNLKTGARLPETQQTPFYKLEKSRCFTCMIDFPREEGGRPVKTEHYITIHDQGGKFEFDYSDGRHMVLGMRNTCSFGMQRETFVIFIQEGDQKGKTLIYSWGNPGADRIGFNPGWIRVQCDLDTPENRALQKGLRPDS